MPSIHRAGWIKILLDLLVTLIPKVLTKNQGIISKSSPASKVQPSVRSDLDEPRVSKKAAQKRPGSR
jgi:hypothetical protein